MSSDKFTIDYYKGRLNATGSVDATVNTKGFLKLKFTESTSGIGDKLYNEAAKQLKKGEISQYNKLKRKYGAEEAFKKVAKQNYPGIVIKENHDRQYFDWRTGGSQVVVFDTKRIKTK